MLATVTLRMRTSFEYGYGSTAPHRDEGVASMTTDPYVLVADDGPVRWLTLNRGAQRNPLSLAMIAALHTALDEAATAPNVRTLVITGDGPGFCAGHDLREIEDHRADVDGGVQFFEQLMSACGEMMQAIVHHPRPVIACVNGVATAAGAQMVASCDLAYAVDTARFGTPGVNIGLFCSTPMVAVSRNVHNKHAMEMLLTGDMIDVAKAEQIGLINKALPENALRDEVMRVSTIIASKSMHTLRIGKDAFYRQRELSLADAYAYTSDVMVKNLLANDAKEGISAFVHKRTPVWQDS
jgi:enoyl-CoA hydratase/carnithine racemase